MNKEFGDPEIKPIDKVAVKFYLYTPLDPHGQRDYTFEKKLSELESFLGDPYWINLCTDMVSLQGKEHRQLIALIIAVMYMRHPKQFERTKFIHKSITDWILGWSDRPNQIEHSAKRSQITAEQWEKYSNFGDEDLKRLWISQIGAVNWMAGIFVKMRWSVVFADNPVFITSDNPVTVTHPSLTFRGFKNKETTLLFPLSPTRVLIMDHKMEEKDGLFYPLSGSPAAWNLAIWNNDIDYIFCSEKPDIFIEDLVKFIKS